MSESVVAQKACGRVQIVPEGEREALLAIAQEIPDLIRLGRGDPDLDTQSSIVEAAVDALRHGCTHYTHWMGIPELRQAISAKLRADNSLSYDPKTEVVVTTGVQEAMYVLFQCLLNPGDEVLIADPFYTSYEFMVSYADGKLIHVPTYETEDFVLQPKTILEHITPKTKAIVVVTPNNPTGAVIPEEILKEIASIAIDRDLIVVSDEIYEKIIFDGFHHVSIASLPGMYERSIVLNGFSKAYSMTGWRIGYMAAPKDFVKKCQMLKYTLTISSNHATQKAALAALKAGDEGIKKTVSTYRERRRLVMSRLDEMGLTYGYPAGAMYVFVNITRTGRNSYEFCLDLLKDAHIQIFPGTVYGVNGEGYVRISLMAPVDVLEEAMNRMNAVVRSYSLRQ